MGRIWESINASNHHMLTNVPNGQIAGSPLCLGVEPKFRMSKNGSESIIRQAPDVADTPTEALNALNRSLLQGGDEFELTYVEFPLAQVIGTLLEFLPPVSSAA